MRNSYPFKLLKALIFISLLSDCNKDLKEMQPQNASSADFSTSAIRPNIILIIADDVGREIPTYNGGQSYNTPNLDYLAANGKQFSNFLSHPDGPPSRLALVTGKYNYRNWVQFGYLPPSSLTFANMLQNRGYATCFTGKWQFDGGDISIRSHGFKKYLVFMPFNPDDNNGHDQFYRRYKNPYLYTDAHYLTDAQVKNKYSEDMFLDYAGKFIDSNKSKPFLLVYSHNLVQKPWVPTPDDPNYAAWNPAVDDATKADTAYFPGMVAYMDKTIGRLVTKVKNAGLLQKTVIIVISDNATNGVIRSKYKGKIVKGAKDQTIFDGINVPMIAYCPGSIAAGTDTSLVDMTDFFPTFAEIAGAAKTPYEPLDGATFYDNLRGAILPSKQRSEVYCYWPRTYQGKIDLSYATDYNYKLYDSLNGGGFYNIRKDIYEKSPIPNKQLTDDEKKIRNKFRKILRQGFEGQ
ncbi:MAG TPA: sulfatase-like hydrolase/transferase [Parafilimonas sp.]|nr:sulfatase-like hydrolase/transferase [Parafilimonas sp.]